MKKQLLFLGLAAAASFSSSAQVTTVTVSIGASYANQKWYSLQNGEQGTQSKDNWDIAFETTGYSSAILANTQKTNFALYKAPYSISGYTTLDTTGMSSWTMLYNSDTTWTLGAFNRGANPSNPSDLGWGVYDMSTHYVNGDSCYVVKLSATSCKKLRILTLANGAYNFEYADINGANSFTQSVSKAAYTGKNFAYFNLGTNAAVDREPVSANWDLTFAKYTAFIPTPYGVAGVMANKGVRIAQLDNVASPSTYSVWNGPYYSGNITTIGYDWKTFDLSNNVWKIAADTVYFVQDRAGQIWKMRFTGFGGSTTGDFVFSKEKLSTTGFTGINEEGQTLATVSLYPNPAIGDVVSLVYSNHRDFTNVALKVYDLTGHEILSEGLQPGQGLYEHRLSLSGFSSGIYIINVYTDGRVTSQKLIRQ